ncbi:MAG: cation:proton antiporter [Gammaproteobacteria bacterium]
MTFTAWIAVSGALLLIMALSSAWMRRLPVSTASIYLGIGILMGPWGFAVLRLDLSRPSPWLERFTEMAVVLSLFVGGLRLRLPLRHPAWRAAWRLASVVMLASILGTALIAWLALGIPLALALLVAALLAPTDPVLAGSVTVDHSQDNDRLRYALSGEAGLNDGAAFPFVVLALLILGMDYSPSALASWAVTKLLWAIPAALAIGAAMGWLVGSVAIALRSRNRDTAAPTDFLALALIALSYTAAVSVGAWGFLAVFAAGIGLRRAEIRTVETTPHPDTADRAGGAHPPAETLVAPNTVTEKEMAEPAVAAGVLVAEVFSFGDTVERILEVLLVVLVGAALAAHLDWRGIVLGLALMILVRPPATFLCLIGTPIDLVQRGLIGWFGIRGIGSIYYLAYALNHGLSPAHAHLLADLTVSAVATSIVIHGLTSRPLMGWYESRRRGGKNRAPVSAPAAAQKCGPRVSGPQ